jgi:hypothetical protein
VTAPLCFIDTETTGLHADRKVWEIAMIRREAGHPGRSTTFFVEVDLSNADPFGLSVGRFYERHPVGRWIAGLAGPTEMPTAEESGSYLTAHAAALLVAKYTHGAHLVGSVPNFDAETLAPLLEWENLTPSWHYHLVDVENLAAGYCAGRWAQAAADGHPAESGPFQPLPWKSDELSRACGVEPPTAEERHTAFGDAHWAMRLYDAITTGQAATAERTDA